MSGFWVLELGLRVQTMGESALQDSVRLLASGFTFFVLGSRFLLLVFFRFLGFEVLRFLGFEVLRF